MRTFEVLLILVNLLSLFLNSKKYSKTVWLWTGGVNLALFFIHGIFEGFRYQMAFSYMFVIVFVIFTLEKTNDKFLEVKVPKALKVIVISLSFVFLVFTSFLAYALPVFKLPKPTGSYDVGIHYFHLIDENRTDPFLDGSVKKRELMVKVYYPAKKDVSKSFSPYFHSPQLIELFAAFYNLPDFAFDHQNLVKTISKEDLVLSDQQQSYPVIVLGQRRTQSDMIFLLG